MGEVFKGSEAVSNGRLTKYALQRWYRPIYRGIYVPKHTAITIRDRTVGAWLASEQHAVITGVAASALHGADWVDTDIPIELVSRNVRPQRGLIVRNEAMAEDEMIYVAKLPVTTVARTAFDLGRHLPRGQALARLDALMRARPFSIEDVQLLAKRYRGARGIRQLVELLPLVDGGAASLQETRLRLLFIDAGFPKPTTQIPVLDERGRHVRTLDMGWEDFMVAAEYDGDLGAPPARRAGGHQTSRAQYVKDHYVLPRLQRLGSDVMSVIREDYDDDVIARTYQAMVSRGWTRRLRRPQRRH